MTAAVCHLCNTLSLCCLKKCRGPGSAVCKCVDVGKTEGEPIQTVRRPIKQKGPCFLYFLYFLHVLIAPRVVSQSTTGHIPFDPHHLWLWSDRLDFNGSSLQLGCTNTCTSSCPFVIQDTCWCQVGTRSARCIIKRKIHTYLGRVCCWERAFFLVAFSPPADSKGNSQLRQADPGCWRCRWEKKTCCLRLSLCWWGWRLWWKTRFVTAAVSFQCWWKQQWRTPWANPTGQTGMHPTQDQMLSFQTNIT